MRRMAPIGRRGRVAPEDIVSAAEQVVRDIEAHGHHICFEYAGVSTAYRSDESGTSEWMTRFFEGYFEPSEGRGGDVTVYSTGDAALHASLQGSAPELLGNGRGEHRRIPLTDSVTLVRKRAGTSAPRDDVFLLLSSEERRIVLVAAGHPDVRRDEGMQLVRAAVKWLLLEQGWIPMHSACAARDGRAVCITGPKASGKTSTLLNLLARNGCDLLAVDKFLIRDGGAHLEVCGIPGKAGIRVGSAIVQPRVLDWLAQPSPSFFPHISAEEVQHIAATNTPAQLRTRAEKVHLLPTELAALFGRSIAPAAPLELVLIPAFDPDIEEARLTATRPEPAIRMLTECYVGLASKGEDFLLHFFDLDDTPIQQRLAAALSKHVPRIATYEVCQSHRTNEQATELVAELL
jgi:hypothetical protein